MAFILANRVVTEDSKAFGMAEAVDAALVQSGAKEPSPGFALTWVFGADEGVEANLERFAAPPTPGLLGSALSQESKAGCLKSSLFTYVVCSYSHRDWNSLSESLPYKGKRFISLWQGGLRHRNGGNVGMCDDSGIKLRCEVITSWRGDR